MSGKPIVTGFKVVSDELKSLVNPSIDTNVDLRFQFQLGQTFLLPPLRKEEIQMGLSVAKIVPCKRGFHFCYSLTEAVINYWQITSRMKHRAMDYRVVWVSTDSDNVVYVGERDDTPGKFVTDNLTIEKEISRAEVRAIMEHEPFQGALFNEFGCLV